MLCESFSVFLFSESFLPTKASLNIECDIGFLAISVASSIDSMSGWTLDVSFLYKLRFCSSILTEIFCWVSFSSEEKWKYF